MLCATDNCNYVCPIIIMCKKTLKYNSTVIGRRYYAYLESLVPLFNKISCSKRRNILNPSNVGCFWLAIGKCAHNMNQYRLSYENGSYYPCNFRLDLYFGFFLFVFSRTQRQISQESVVLTNSKARRHCFKTISSSNI